MKKDYNVENFDYENYYYFLDDGKYFKISKGVSPERFYELNNEFYHKTDSDMFRYLFEDGQFPYEKPFYKTLVFDLDKVENDTKTSFLKFVQGLMNRIELLELRNKTIAFYFEDYQLDFRSIFKTVNDDLGVSIKVFESGMINANNNNAFRTLFEAYLKNSYSNSRLYTTTSELVLDIAKKNINQLKVLKPIILNNVYKDTQLEKLILSMFENNLNVTQTAKDVFMHRNTINNKLEFIRKQTNLNIQNFQEAVAMYLLLKN